MAPDLPFEPPPGYEVKWLTPVHWENGAPFGMIIAAGIALALILPCLIGFAFAPALSGSWSSELRRQKKRVALVVAHPDDEAVFFWPTLRELRGVDIPVAVLCLSTGNADGLGKERTAEMRRSCSRLGIVDKSLKIINDPLLQDGFHFWPEAEVAKHVSEFLVEHRVDLVITFDDLGVSGHPNHRSASRGVRFLRSKGTGPVFDVYMLDSIGVHRKYVGPLCLLLQDARLEASFCLDPTASLRALVVHWTQLVWYRVLFTLFSHYVYVNTFTYFEPTSSDDASCRHGGERGTSEEAAESESPSEESTR
mmetsp:Transcript_2981/g.4899  ORF Transcript_2981/g.4899 Transcript_2981/m.4899 type:complete len:308 (-) Transcript_2981:19-942(-)